MTGRAKPPVTTSEPIKLALPRSEVAEKLQARISAGNEIQRRMIQSAKDLDSFGADSTKWMEYNYDLLKVLFTNDDVANEYLLSIPQFLITRDLRRNFQNAQTKNARQITKLESILDRLDLYVDAPAVAAFSVARAEELIPHAALAEIRASLSEIKAKLPTLAASNAVQTEIHLDIAQIEAEVERPTPRRSLVKVFLESLREHLVAAAAGGLVTAIGAILGKYFGAF